MPYAELIFALLSEADLPSILEASPQAKCSEFCVVLAAAARKSADTRIAEALLLLSDVCSFSSRSTDVPFRQRTAYFARAVQNADDLTERQFDELAAAVDVIVRSASSQSLRADGG